MTTPIVNANTRVIPGRECGSCSLCCKVYTITELDKPAGKWCTHCKPGKGCVIHDALPTQCIEFNCLWRTEASIGPDWKPDRSKMVLTISPVNGYINVQVDAGAPQAGASSPITASSTNGRGTTCRRASTSSSSSTTWRP